MADDPVVTGNLQRQLRELGFEPVAAARWADEAISLSGRLRPDLALLDVVPTRAEAGGAAAQAIRERFRIPVVFLATPADEEILRRTGRAGPLGCIIRPLAGRDLRNAIEAALCRHQLELRLHESEARYRAVTSLAQEAIITADPAGTICRWNRGAELIFGYTENEARGRNLSLLIPALAGATPPAGLRPGAEGTPFAGPGMEMTGRRKDQSGFPLELALARWECADGPCLTAVVRDLTSRKRAEDRVRTLSQAVEQSPVTIVITDPAGNIEYVNPKFTDLSGYRREEVLGRNPRVLKSGKMRPQVYQEIWQALTAGRVWSGELHNRKKNGDLFWERATIAPLRDESGKTIHFVAVKEDITKRKQLETKLAHARDAAVKAASLKSEFLANVSHEIRTPVNGIFGMADMMLDMPLDPDQREMSEVIKRSADALLVIVNDILDFSKIEAGKFRIVANDFELRPLVDETLAMLAPRAHAKQLVLRCERESAAAGPLHGDSGRIRQVLMNLLGNAIKFTERGEVAVSVRETVTKEGRVAIRVAVRDTGIGIPPAEQAKLFQPFTQVDGSSTRRFGGTGLGLAISRQLIELMGGTIGFESEQNRGSTFWFELEFARGGEIPRAIPAEDASAAPQVTGLRLLVVDDNPQNQVVAQVMLRRMGHLADVVGDGAEALAQLQRETYAAVMMDCQMPVLDGYDAARRIRAGKIPGVNPRIPIIAVTAYAQAEDRQKCLDAGMDEYLAKPVRSAELRAALQRCGLVNGTFAPFPARPRPAVVPAGEAPGDVLDLELMEMMRKLPGRDGPSLLPELIRVFMQEETARFAELAARVNEHNPTEVARLAHSFAGSCASVGARQMRTAVIAIERSAGAGTWAEVPAQLAALQEARSRFHLALARHGLHAP